MEVEQHVLKSDAMTQTAIFALVPQPINAIAVVLLIMLMGPILAYYAATQSLTAQSAHILAHSLAQLALLDTIQALLLTAQHATADRPTAYTVIQQVLALYGAMTA